MGSGHHILAAYYRVHAVETSSYAWLIVLLAVVGAVVVLAFAAAAVRRGIAQGRAMPRVCRACEAPHPSFAQYCNRCGRKL